jgi:hypothetical protein
MIFAWLDCYTLFKKAAIAQSVEELECDKDDPKLDSRQGT